MLMSEIKYHPRLENSVSQEFIISRVLFLIYINSIFLSIKYTSATLMLHANDSGSADSRDTALRQMEQLINGIHNWFQTNKLDTYLGRLTSCMSAVVLAELLQSYKDCIPLSTENGLKHFTVHFSFPTSHTAWTSGAACGRTRLRSIEILQHRALKSA